MDANLVVVRGKLDTRCSIPDARLLILLVKKRYLQKQVIFVTLSAVDKSTISVEMRFIA